MFQNVAQNMAECDKIKSEKKNVDKMNLKILFYEMVSNTQFFFFVKSYASVPLHKMQKFIKNRKKVVKSRQYKNVGQKLFAQL